MIVSLDGPTRGRGTAKKKRKHRAGTVMGAEAKRGPFVELPRGKSVGAAYARSGGGTVTGRGGAGRGEERPGRLSELHRNFAVTNLPERAACHDDPQ
jgi:hypothetical protein